MFKSRHSTAYSVSGADDLSNFDAEVTVKIVIRDYRWKIEV